MALIKAKRAGKKPPVDQRGAAEQRHQPDGCAAQERHAAAAAAAGAQEQGATRARKQRPQASEPRDKKSPR